jgi:hypothetical protein
MKAEPEFVIDGVWLTEKAERSICDRLNLRRPYRELQEAVS